MFSAVSSCAALPGMVRRFHLAPPYRFALAYPATGTFEGATSDLIDYVMRFEGMEMRPAMDVVYRSQLFSKLENPNTGLYREGPVYLYDMLCSERGMKLPVKKIYEANRQMR